MHVAGVTARRASPSSTSIRRSSATQRELLVSELAGRASVLEKAARAGIAPTRSATRRIVERVKELEHAGYQFEAADGSFELLLRRESGALRAAVHARVLARDRRAARRRRGRPPRPRSRSGSTASATCGSPRATGRSTRSTARCAPRSARSIPHLARHRARQLQGPHPRREQGHRRGHARAARRLRRARRVGLDRGVARTSIAASWEALVDSLEHGMVLAAVHARVSDAEIPLARPVLGEAEERAVLEVLRSGQLSLGPLLAEFERMFAARVGSPYASAVTSGTAGLHLALRAVGVEAGDEVVTSPFSFVASANAIVYERARPVFADIDPRHAESRPGGGCGGCDRAHAGGAAGAHLRLSRRHARVRADRSGGCRSSRTPARRSARASCRRERRRRARASGGLRVLRQQADDDRRGGDGHARRPGAEGADRLRAQPGARRRHGLARSRPARLQLPAVGRGVRARARSARAPR